MIALSELPYIEWTDPDTGAVSRIYADAVTDESPNLPAQVSSHAVEKGSKITDHYRKDSESVSITYAFSNAPLRGDLDPDNPGQRSKVALRYEPNKAKGAPLYTPGGLVQGATGAIGGLLGLGPPPLPKSFDPLTFAGPVDRLSKVTDIVRDLQTRGILVTVKTTVGRFPDCGILNFAPKREPGGKASATFELQQLRFVSSDIALALPLPVEPRGLPKKNSSAAGAGKAAQGEEESAARKGLRAALGHNIGGAS